MAQSGIYEIVNLVNGKRYVGSSVNLQARWKVHLRKLRTGRHHNAHLRSAFAKYGESNFSFVILEECEREKIIDREQSAIDALNPEYNIAPLAGSILGVTLQEEVKDRIRAANIGKTHTSCARAKMSAAKTGTKHSAETRAKMSAAHKGKKKGPLSEARCKQISENQAGKKRGPYKPRTAEHSAAIAAALTGKKFGPRKNKAA